MLGANLALQIRFVGIICVVCIFVQLIHWLFEICWFYSLVLSVLCFAMHGAGGFVMHFVVNWNFQLRTAVSTGFAIHVRSMTPEGSLGGLVRKVTRLNGECKNNADWQSIIVNCAAS